MEDRELRIVLRISLTAERIGGMLEADGAIPVAFAGWIELTSQLERAVQTAQQQPAGGEPLAKDQG